MSSKRGGSTCSGRHSCGSRSSLAGWRVEQQTTPPVERHAAGSAGGTVRCTAIGSGSVRQARRTLPHRLSRTSPGQCAAGAVPCGPESPGIWDGRPASGSAPCSHDLADRALTLDGFAAASAPPRQRVRRKRRRVWNGAVDRRPAMIACDTQTSDVVAAVRFASGTICSWRCAAVVIHPGQSVCDGGLLIDLSEMKAIDVDRVARRADAQPGVMLSEYDSATQVHGWRHRRRDLAHRGRRGLTSAAERLASGVHGLACDKPRRGRAGDCFGRGLAVSESPTPSCLGTARRRWELRDRHPLHLRAAPVPPCSPAV